MMKIKTILIAIGVSLILGNSTVQAQNVGEPAPEFSFKDTEGVTHSLSQYEGKVVFIFVLGNQCPLCKAVGNDTETRIEQVYGPREDFQSLGIDTWNHTYTPLTIGEFQSYTGITYPILVEAESFESLYGTSYDHFLVVNQEGVLSHKNNSLGAAADLDNVIAKIDELLSVSGVEEPEAALREGFGAVYPNPAGNLVNLEFYLDKGGPLSLKVCNSTGKETDLLQEEFLEPGKHHRELNVSAYVPGVYFLRMETAGMSFSHRLLISR